MAKLNILIVDYTTHHPEIIAALRRMFAGHDIRLVLTSSFQAKFSGWFGFEPDTTLIKPKRMKLREWLESLAPIYARQDIVIFSTAIRDPLLVATLKLPTAAKKIAMVHNVHYFTETFAIDRKSYRDVFDRESHSLLYWLHFTAHRWKSIKRQIKHVYSGTRFAQAARLIDYFCFGSEHLASHFAAITGLHNVLMLPIYSEPYPESRQRPRYDGTLRIAIVGLVSPDRRNYLETIRALTQARFFTPLELHILGRCPDRRYGEKIFAEIQRIADPNFKIIFDPHSPFISADIMRERLSSMHLLLNPLQPAFSFQFHCEEYGKSKLSGAESDCVRYHRPILLPEFYRCGNEIAPFVVSYENFSDLAEKIRFLQREDNLSEINKRSNNFSASEMSKELAKKFIAQCYGSPGEHDNGNAIPANRSDDQDGNIKFK